MVKNKHIVFCPIGRTASGKTELAKRIAKDLGLILLKSYTTRGMRPEEIADPENVDHIYISDEVADELLSTAQVVAYTEIKNKKAKNKTRYFATLQQLREADLYVIDPQGYEGLEATLRNLNISDIELAPVYISATKNVRHDRFVSRDENPDAESDFQTRDSDENNQFNKFELKIMAKDKKFLTSETMMAHIIKNNGSFEDAVKEFKKVVKVTK